MKAIELSGWALEVLQVLSLAVQDTDEVQVQQGLSRMLLYRKSGGLNLGPPLEEALDEALARTRQKDLEELVVVLLEGRRWTLPLPLVPLELAVREHLTRQGFAWQVAREAGERRLFRVSLAWREGSGKVHTEEVEDRAPWHGLLRLKARAKRLREVRA